MAGDDALKARWFDMEELDRAGLALSLDVAEVKVLHHWAATFPARGKSRRADVEGGDG